MAQVAAATDTEVGADEGIHSLEDIKRHRTTALVEAGRLCAQPNTSVNISCMTGESSIACAAALHAASVLPDIAWALTLTHTGLAEDISGAPVPTANGHVNVLKRPGLDVEVDEDLLRRYRVTVAVSNVA